MTKTFCDQCGVEITIDTRSMDRDRKAVKVNPGMFRLDIHLMVGDAVCRRCVANAVAVELGFALRENYHVCECKKDVVARNLIVSNIPERVCSNPENDATKSNG